MQRLAPIVALTLIVASTSPVRAAAAQPLAQPDGAALGSLQNAVRASGPAGEHEYLARLRCPSGSVPAAERSGSLRGGADEHIHDGWVLRCDGEAPVSIAMDMYHPRHREMRAIPGFTLLAELPARVAPGCPPQVVADADSSARYVFSSLEVERPVRLARQFDASAPVVVGLQGMARVGFVVDTLGRPEPESVKVLSITDERLRPHVEAALARLPLAPAEHRPGCRVRQSTMDVIFFR